MLGRLAIAPNQRGDSDMAINNSNELDRAQRRSRRTKKTKDDASIRREPTAWTEDDCPTDLAAQFLGHFAALDQAPQTTHFEQLRRHGLDLPNPNSLDDVQVCEKVWEVIRKLAEMNVFVTSTNHLSDRELYERLWSDVLHEWTMDAALPDMTCHLDLVGSGSDHDIAAWLRYYADADDRARWQRDFPGQILPPRSK